MSPISKLRDSARNTRAKAAANGKESNAQATANGQQNEAPNSLAKRNAQNENAAQIPTARTTPFPTGTWAFVNKDDLQRRVTKIGGFDVVLSQAHVVRALVRSIRRQHACAEVRHTGRPECSRTAPFAWLAERHPRRT